MQCSRIIYVFAKNDRTLWEKAQDPENLPLPTGHTIKTVPIDLLFPLALRCFRITKSIEGRWMIPKHVSNIPISTSFGVPTHAAVPGGRWFLYYALEGIKFLDTAKVPIQDGILLTEDSNPPDIFGMIGGGVVRCGTTSYDATPNK